MVCTTELQSTELCDISDAFRLWVLPVAGLVPGVPFRVVGIHSIARITPSRLRWHMGACVLSLTWHKPRKPFQKHSLVAFGIVSSSLTQVGVRVGVANRIIVTVVVRVLFGATL